MSYVEGVQVEFVILFCHVLMGTLASQLLGPLLAQGPEVIFLVELGALVPIELVVHLVIVGGSGVLLSLGVVVDLDLGQ